MRRVHEVRGVRAAGSLHETLNHLHDAHTRGYLTAAEHEALRRLALRAIKATTRLIAYLEVRGAH